MKKIARYTLAFITMCLVPLDTKAAEFETASQVQSWCMPIVGGDLGRLGKDLYVKYRHNHDTGFCLGAFKGIQGLSYTIWADNTPILGFCPPTDSTTVQYITIFSHYVDDHPDIANESFFLVALRALAAAFPCKQ